MFPSRMSRLKKGSYSEGLGRRTTTCFAVLRAMVIRM
uniref:Uncharacterized protein n=1 Tax=Arundo donax TaxID=35708 RepID=A0A0A9EK75_ARUDO